MRGIGAVLRKESRIGMTRSWVGHEVSEPSTLLFLDPPDHTRLRALVSKAFTPRAVDALESRVRSILGTLLEDIDDPSAFDLMEAVARPLPVTVMAEMLGVPAEDRARFAVWAAQRARLLEPTISRREREAGGAAFSSVRCAYFRPRFRQGIVLRSLQSLQVKALP